MRSSFLDVGFHVSSSVLFTTSVFYELTQGISPANVGGSHTVVIVFQKFNRVGHIIKGDVIV